MVDQAEFFSVMDRLVEGGRIPTQREIRAELGRGSFTDIASLLVDWAVARDLRLHPRRDTPRQKLMQKLEAIAAEIWADGIREGVQRAQVGRARERHWEVLYREAAWRLEVLEELHGARKATTDAKPQGPEPDAMAENFAPVVQTLAEPTLPVIPAEAGEQITDAAEAVAPTRRERIDTWDRVLQVAYDVLGYETLAATTINARVWARLTPEMRLAAKHLDERGGPGLLASKMRRRASQGRNFHSHADGRFSRLRVAVPADGANGQPGPLTEATTDGSGTGNAAT